MNPVISVIIPTYNRANLLERALLSVLSQTYKNKEIIIVDDGSVDHTEEVVAPYLKNQSIHFVKKTNSGVAAARNTGVEHSCGEYIAFLDSDDEWVDNKLEEQVQFFENNQSFRVVFTDEIWVRNGVRVNPKKSHQKFGGQIFHHCLEQCFIAPSSILIEKKLFKEMNGFDESFIVCEDYDLWLRISSIHEIGFLPKFLIKKYGGHDDQLSTKFFAMDLWRIKSMKKLLDENKISENQKERIFELMETKGAILIKGYQKHGNLEAVKVVLDLLKNN